MHINRENYEAYLLDLIEGELSPELEKDVMQFLAENPDLDTGPGILDITLPTPDLTFPSKDDIRKGAYANRITRGNFDQFCIARLEGDLSVSASKALDDFLLNNPECEREAGLYGLVKLKADETIEYPGKHLLKRRETALSQLKGVFMNGTLYRPVAIAASVAILLSASIFIRYNGRIDQIPVRPLFRELPVSQEIGQNKEITEGSVPEFPREPSVDINKVSLISTPLESEIFQPEAIIQDNGAGRSIGILPGDRKLSPMPGRHLTGKVELKTAYSRPQISPVSLAVQYSAPVYDNEDDIQVQGRILKGIAGIFSRALDEDQERERLTLWDVADAGFRGLNFIAGTDLRLEREYNEDGDLVTMAFNSRLIEFQRSAKTSQE